MKDKLCVVNFSNGGWYNKGQNRLKDSLISFNHTNFIMFNNYEDIDCHSHDVNPYAFKIYSILKAKSMGYTKILWLDASCWLQNSLDSIDNVLETDDIFIEYGGECVGNWTNDRTIQYFKTTRDELMQVPIVVAGVCGFNFNSELSNIIFNEWKTSCDDGMFIGKWNNNDRTESHDDRCRGHRHDLSSLSIISWKLNAKRQNPNTFLNYVYPNHPIDKNASILLQGM